MHKYLFGIGNHIPIPAMPQYTPLTCPDSTRHGSIITSQIDLTTHPNPKVFYLPADIPPESTLSAAVTDYSSRNSSHSTAWSNSDHSHTESTESTVRFRAKRGVSSRNDNPTGEEVNNDGPQLHREKLSLSRTGNGKPHSSNRLVLPLSKLSRQPAGLLQFSSFDSTLTTVDNTVAEHSSISRCGISSKDSVLALQGVPLSVEESLYENVNLAESEYSKMPVPLPRFMHQGTKPDENFLKGRTYHKSCSKLPVCKRIAGKYMLRDERETRSSSVESVIAETLPDLDNAMVEIAGKIANEPINRFPILKKPPSRRPSRLTTTGKRLLGGGGRATGTFDVHRIEQDVSRELKTFQDYTNVSEFFSQNRSARDNSLIKARKGTGLQYLTRPVTNPLYKVYDPAGYKKSEDELAQECIQMVCDDFNKWIKSLASAKQKSCTEKTDQDSEADLDKNVRGEENGQPHDIPVIGPEFLIQILRKDLELPENKA